MRYFVLAIVTLCSFVTSLYAQRRNGSIEITGDVKVSELVKKHIEFNEHMKTVPGFRVQIAALSGANSRNQAFELKNRFKLEHPEVEVYIAFSEPNFRVKVGDFTSRLDAYVFMQKIKDKYPGTIVKEYVYPVHLDMSDIVPETDDDVNNDNVE